MSHFTVLVVGDDPEEQLAPFDEDIEVPRYVLYTKEELIEKEKLDLKGYKETIYQKYLDNKEQYKEFSKDSPNHIKYLEEIFPRLLSASDEELYQHTIGFYPKEQVGLQGEVYSTYNPKSKWDWYVPGGRWRGYFTLKDGSKVDSAKKEQITSIIKPTFAVLKDGTWHEQGIMGWWAIVIDGKSDEEWGREFSKLIDSLSDDTRLSLYDCHI